jgi:hypothetical protein
MREWLELLEIILFSRRLKIDGNTYYLELTRVILSYLDLTGAIFFLKCYNLVRNGLLAISTTCWSIGGSR